jgi:hypothetical protein
VPIDSVDLASDDFKSIIALFGRLFDHGVISEASSITTAPCPTDEFCRTSLQGKHVWINAATPQEMRDKLLYFQSEYDALPRRTSACVLFPSRSSFPVQLVKGWREILLLPRGVVIRRLYSDGSWQSELTKETLRVLYLPPECNESVAVLDGAIVQHSVLSASKTESDPTLRMMFAGRAAGTNASILFDSGASDNFVSSSFARQTGISVTSVQRKVRLSSDDIVTSEGEANVYLKMETYQQSVGCVVMPLLHEVDVILDQKFMSAHKCILDFERSMVLMKRGRQRVTVARAPVHGRVNPDSSTNSLAVLSALQLRRAYKKGHRVYLAVIKPTDDPVDNPADNTVKDNSAGLPHSASNYLATDITDPSGKERWVSGLVEEFLSVFQDPLPSGLPPERDEGHSIPIEPGHPPPFRPVFRLSPLEYSELKKQVSAFLEAGILEPSKSPYGAPVMFVPKPNGRGLRLRVDYRALNAITVKNRYPIPRIDDLLDAVPGVKFFTSLDLTFGYHQVLISEEDRPKTTFCTPMGHFQFKVLIEELTIAPATFQSVMNSVFHPFLRRFVVVYLDDMLIYSKSAEEHKLHVRQVLELLRSNRFYVCKAK